MIMDSYNYIHEQKPTSTVAATPAKSPLQAHFLAAAEKKELFPRNILEVEGSNIGRGTGHHTMAAMHVKPSKQT